MVQDVCDLSGEKFERHGFYLGIQTLSQRNRFLSFSCICLKDSSIFNFPDESYELC